MSNAKPDIVERLKDRGVGDEHNDELLLEAAAEIERLRLCPQCGGLGEIGGVVWSGNGNIDPDYRSEPCPTCAARAALEPECTCDSLLTQFPFHALKCPWNPEHTGEPAAPQS